MNFVVLKVLKAPGIISRLAIFLISGFVHSSVHAQYGYELKHFNINSGLNHNSILAVSKGHSGYLWLGTTDGLMRYDGTKFTPYTLDSTAKRGSQSNYVISINDVPGEDVLLVLTATGNSFVVKKGKPVHFLSKPGSNVYYTIAGKIPSLKSFRDVSLHFKDTARLNQQYFDKPPGSLIFINNTDFLYYNDNQLAYFRNNIKQQTVFLPAAFKSFCWKGNNVFIADKKDGLWLFDNKSRALIQVKGLPAGKGTVNYFNDALSGNLYYQENSSFYQLEYDAGKNEFTYQYLVNIKDVPFIWDGLAVDIISSTLFLRTVNNGFVQVKMKKSTTINTNKLRSVPRDAPGEFINFSIGKTSDSSIISPSGFEIIAGNQQLQVHKLGNIFGERQTIGYLDNEVICTEKGKIYYYTPKDGYRIRHEFNKAYNQLDSTRLSMLQVEGDSLWAITRSKVYSLRKNTFKEIVSFPMQSGGRHLSYHSTFTRLNPQEALVGGISGLYKLRTIAPYKIDTIAALKGKWVRGICQYNKFLLLAIYREGLYVGYNDQYYKVPLTQEETALELCHSIYIDKKDRMWVPTDRGLYMGSADVIIKSALAKDKIAPYFFRFGQEDGIENIEFNGSGSPAYAVLNDERLFYPSMGGIVTFKPDELAVALTSHHINIDKITVGNKPQDVSSDTFYLDAATSTVTIQLNEPFFGDRVNLDIEYSLDNKEWVRLTVDDNQLINITGLQPGSHSLHIRKRNGFGANDFAHRSLTIYKREPFYEQIWFYIVMGLLLVSMVWLFLRIKTRNLENKRKALQQLVDKQTAELINSVETKDLLIKIITHDMVSPLRHIGVVSKVLSKGLEKDPERVTQSLNDINSTSGKILSDSLSILNWIKYSDKRVHVEKKPVLLYACVQELTEAFTPIARDRDIRILNKIPETKVVTADRNILQTVLNNIISNSLKYATEGDVVISLADDGADSATITISDSGIGMNEKVLDNLRAILQGNVRTLKENDVSSTGLGYLMIAQLIKIHGWSVWVDSDPGKGTVVSINIKD